MTCLDWLDRDHWNGRPAPCRHCGRPTPLRDGAGRPAHKVCAERALDLLLHDDREDRHR